MILGRRTPERTLFPNCRKPGFTCLLSRPLPRIRRVKRMPQIPHPECNAKSKDKASAARQPHARNAGVRSQDEPEYQTRQTKIGEVQVRRSEACAVQRMAKQSR